MMSINIAIYSQLPTRRMHAWCWLVAPANEWCVAALSHWAGPTYCTLP